MQSKETNTVTKYEDERKLN